MAKYVINRGSQTEKKVEANSFQLIGNYWYFEDASGTKFVVAAERVISISREDG